MVWLINKCHTYDKAALISIIQPKITIRYGEIEIGIIKISYFTVLFIEGLFNKMHNDFLMIIKKV